MSAAPCRSRNPLGWWRRLGRLFRYFGQPRHRGSLDRVVTLGGGSAWRNSPSCAAEANMISLHPRGRQGALP
ncbi:MAG: hypothetical protein ACLSHC_00300 [Bilophila wadsworthia]